MRYRIAVALVILTLAACWFTLSPKSQEYVSEDGGFSVRFPTRGELKTDAKDAPHGMTYVTTSTQVGDRAFTVSYMGLPTAADKAVAPKSLLDGSTAKMSGKRISESDFTFGPAGLPARELVIEKDGKVMRMHVIAGATRMYIIGVLGADADTRDRVANDFLTSLQIKTPGG